MFIMFVYFILRCNMSWKVDFYNDKVKQEIIGWPKRLRIKFLRVVELIEEMSPQSVGMPHIKALKQGLFEIRVKSDEGIGRAMFCISSGKIVVVLSGFIKKTQKTPDSEIELARKRMKDVQNYEKN